MRGRLVRAYDVFCGSLCVRMCTGALHHHHFRCIVFEQIIQFMPGQQLRADFMILGPHQRFDECLGRLIHITE